jgi:hypothetical protein
VVGDILVDGVEIKVGLAFLALAFERVTKMKTKHLRDRDVKLNDVELQLERFFCMCRTGRSTEDSYLTQKSGGGWVILNRKTLTGVASFSFVWLNTYRDMNVIQKMMSLCMTCRHYHLSDARTNGHHLSKLNRGPGPDSVCGEPRS